MDNYTCGICKKDFESDQNNIAMYLDFGVDVVEFIEQTCPDCMTAVGEAIEQAIEEVQAHVEKM